MAKEFECGRELILPADPDRVWEAVATPEGLSAWQFPSFVPSIRDIATAWDPPHHLGVRMEEGEWFNALEYRIEGQRGGTSILRYVHSGIFMDDWDTQYDAVQQHTDFYLHTLGQYLEFFDGQPATYIGDVPGGVQGPARSAEKDGFDRLKEALGLDVGVVAGTEVDLTPGRLSPISGVVDYAQYNFLGIRTPDALYRFFGRNAFGQPVGMSIHMFGRLDHPDVVKQQWQEWLETSLG
jgi:hypothetical protein